MQAHAKVISMRILLSLALCTTALFAAGETVGRRAPGFSLPDSAFKQHDSQDYRGRILIVEFMQTTCPHCGGFSSILEAVAAKYAGKVAVLSIVNPPDTMQNVSRYVAAHKIRSPILFDCGQVAASFIQGTPQNASFSLPRVFILDANGIIRRDFEYGFLTKEIFEGRKLFTEVDSMLAGSGKK